MLEELLTPARLIPISFAAMAVAGIVFGLLLPTEYKTRKLAVTAATVVLALPLLLFAGVTLSVQGAKSEALAKSQATIANAAIQSETALQSGLTVDDKVWLEMPIVDTSFSEYLKNGLSDEDMRKINSGESLTFSSDKGKTVELSLESGDKEGRVNVVLKYDGKVVESDGLKNLKPSARVAKYGDSWIDQYPTLVKAPSVSKGA